MTEVLPTLATLVRHFSSMDSLVLSEVVFSTEGFSTFTAFVRPLSSMDPLVLHKCGFAAEGFPTLTALVRLFSTMNSLVLDKCVLAAKSFPTLTALVVHLSRIKGLPAPSAPGCLPLSMSGLLLVSTQTSLGFLLLLRQMRLFTNSSVLHKDDLAFTPL